jgi:hypothetical protein
MKKILLAGLVAISVIACKTKDTPSSEGPVLTAESKDSLAAKMNEIAQDTTQNTTIQWLDSTYLDLGKVKEGKMVEVSFRFKNSGTKPLVITSVTASCGCTVPEKPERAFASGEEGTIRAKFDSKGRMGENQKHVTVIANTNPSSSHELSFRVEVTK